MSEAKHTPGPWTAKSFHDGDPGYQYYEVSDLNGQRVAEVEGASKGQGHQHPRPPVREADVNARLIAASPSLLAACKECVAVYEETRDNHPTGHLWPDPNHIVHARDAIAKATVCTAPEPQPKAPHAQT